MPKIIELTLKQNKKENNNMGDFYQRGFLPLIPKEDIANNNHTWDDLDSNQSPFQIPTLYLEGCDYFDTKYPIFNYAKDSIIMLRPNYLVKYTYHHHVEQLIEDEKGNVIWRDVYELEAEGWPGKYLEKTRGNHTFEITEYFLNTMEKKIYKVDLESVAPIGQADYDDLVNYIDPKLIDDINPYFDKKGS